MKGFNKSFGQDTKNIQKHIQQQHRTKVDLESIRILLCRLSPEFIPENAAESRQKNRMRYVTGKKNVSLVQFWKDNESLFPRNDPIPDRIIPTFSASKPSKDNYVAEKYFGVGLYDDPLYCLELFDHQQSTIFENDSLNKYFNHKHTEELYETAMLKEVGSANVKQNKTTRRQHEIEVGTMVNLEDVFIGYCVKM